MIQIKKIKMKIGVLLVIFLFVIIGWYSYARASNLIHGVEIAFSGIKDGETFTDPLIEIKGNADNARDLYLNDRPISVDQSYNFKESLLLLPGYNILTIKGEDKFGKKSEKTIHLVYLPQTQPTDALSIITDTEEKL
jgi:hypothetical protein